MKNLVETIRSMYEAKDYNKDGKIDDHEKDHAAEVGKFKDLEKRLKKLEKDEAEEEKNEAMDPVNKKALKKDFDDRKDKDIDNDGDTDDSDEYLHNRRKAVSKAIKGEGKGEKVEVNPKLDEEAIEEQWSITGKDRNGNSHTIYKTKTGGVYSKTGSGSMTSLANYHKDRKLGTNAAQKDLHSKLSGAKDAKSAAAAANQHTNMRWVHEEVELDEAKITHADESSPGKGKRMTDLTKSQHMDAADHHDREQMIAYKKKQGWNEKHHAMMAKAHRMHAQGVGSSHMYKEEVDIYEAVTVKLRGGKVPVGQHKFIYKVDKSPKYIENSIKERDKNAKVEVKGKDVHVTASAGAHSSFIDSLRKFRANGTVTEEIQMDDMQEGTMSRYELIKKAAQKVNKDDAKAARDAAKGIKKDKDLRKPKKDSADVDEGLVDAIRGVVNKVTGDDNANWKDPDNTPKTQGPTPGKKTSVVKTKPYKNPNAGVNPAATSKPASTDKKAAPSSMNPVNIRFGDVVDHDGEVISEGNAAMELKKYANSKGGIDKQDFIAISNMIAKKKSAKELAMVLKAQDTDPRDKALEIISKNDNKLYHEILKAARGMMPKKTIKKPNLRAQYEEVELEEKVAAYDKNGRVVGLYKDMATAKKLKPNHTYKLVEDYKKDAKDAPFEADPEKKKKQKNSDGSETKPMSRAKQLAKKALVSEAEMTPAQKRKKEEIVKGMKDKKDYFERKYGDRAKDVMYATATKMAMKEGFELTLERFQAGMAVPSDGGPDGGGKAPVYTTKGGTNYKNGKAIGPVSDPDGGSATPAPKKEEKSCKSYKKESTTYSTTATTKDGKTYSKTKTTDAPVVGKKLSAKDYKSSDAGLPTKKSDAKFRPTEEGTVTSVRDAQGGKVGMSDTDASSTGIGTMPAPKKAPTPNMKMSKGAQKVYDLFKGKK